MKKILLFLTAMMTLMLAFGQASAQLVVNEVMANEPGSNVMLEWIELYNNSDDSVFLRLYYFNIDGDPVILPGDWLKADDYAVYCRKLYSDGISDGFEGVWGDGSGVWGDNEEIENYAVYEWDAVGLNNPSGAVVLERAAIPISKLIWESDGADGVSWERYVIDDTVGRQSIDTSGSTPGRLNSITPLDYDLALLPVETDYWGEGWTEFGITVINIGLQRMSSGDMAVSYDPDGDGQADSPDLIAVITYPATDPGDTLAFKVYFELEGMSPLILLELPPDDRLENNSRLVTAFGFDYPPVIINEFIADPQDGLEVEWIELRNRSNEAVDLDGWYLGDEIKFYPIVWSDDFPVMDVIINADDYLVLCKDLNAFMSFYGSTSNVIEMNSWPALNNDGDIIKLRDNFENAVDSFRYDYTFGGNYSWGRGEEPGMTERRGRSIETGGTPGSMNEIYYQAISSNISVTAEPNPFSPSKDGQMTIAFEVPPGDYMTIKIYDTKGRVVRTLVEDVPAFEGEVMWDGRSDGGRDLAVGMYILFLEVADAEQYKQTVVIAP